MAIGKCDEGGSRMSKFKTYDVQIEAIITKTIRVRAVDEDAAYGLAHDIFTVTRDEYEERYQSYASLSLTSQMFNVCCS